MQRVVFLVLLVISVPFLVSAQDREQEETRYRIGVILPLSGDSASVGEPMRDAVRLAYETLPPEKQNLISITFEDDRMSPSQAVTAFHTLTSVKKINAVVVFGSAMGNAVAPLAEKKGIIAVALVASDSKVWSGRKYVFSHWMPLETQAKAMVSEMIIRNYQKVGMISHEQEGINAIDEVFVSELKQQNVEDRLVVQEKYLMGTNDFKSFIGKARSKEVEGVYVVMLPGASVFAKQARSLGLKADFFGVQTFENEAEVKAAEGALLGSWYINAAEPTKEFQQRYQERFSRHPGLGSVNAYDTIQLIAQAVASVGPESAAVAEFLRTVKDYKGAAGTYSATGDGRFTLPVTVKTITEQGFEKLED